MPKASNEIERQVEAAYDFRGHVTLRFKDGESAEGFVYNREFSNPNLRQDYFIEVYLKGSGESRRFPISTLKSIELTGKDYAAHDAHAAPTTDL